MTLNIFKKYSKSILFLICLNIFIISIMGFSTYKLKKIEVTIKLENTAYDVSIYNFLHEISSSHNTNLYLPINLHSLNLNYKNMKKCILLKQNSFWKMQHINRISEKLNEELNLLSLYIITRNPTLIKNTVEICSRQTKLDYLVYKKNMIKYVQTILDSRLKTEENSHFYNQSSIYTERYQEKTTILKNIFSYLKNHNQTNQKLVFKTTSYWSLSMFIFSLLKLFIFNLILTGSLFIVYRRL